MIEMRTESRFEQYDLNLTLPEPLIPRQSRFTFLSVWMPLAACWLIWTALRLKRLPIRSMRRDMKVSLLV